MKENHYELCKLPTDEPPPLKRARQSSAEIAAEVCSLRGSIPFISQSALAALCRHARTHGMPDLSRRDSIRDGRNSLCSALHSVVNVSGVNIEVAHPHRMLEAALGQSQYFRDLVTNRLAAMPSTPERPWHIIMYSDEITPGNQLAHRNRRKAQALYWSFIEFGPWLSDERHWFTVALVRSQRLPSLSELYAKIVELMVGPHNMWYCSAHDVSLFAKFSVNIGDEAALASTFQSMGASGLKCCCLCQNVFDGGSAPGC